jgi:hypothetical protein
MLLDVIRGGIKHADFPQLFLVRLMNMDPSWNSENKNLSMG